MNSETNQPSLASAAAVSTAQGLVSAFALLIAGILLSGEIQNYREWKDAVRRQVPLGYEFHLLGFLVVIVLPAVFGLLGLASSTGHLWRKEWAREVTIFLSIVPVSCYATLVLLRPASLFPTRSVTGTIFAVGGGLVLLAYLGLLIVLIPISVWSLRVMTRPAVRYYFSRMDVPSAPQTNARSDRFHIAFFLWVAFLIGSLMVGLIHL